MEIKSPRENPDAVIIDVREADEWRLRLLPWHEAPRKWLQEPIDEAPAAR